MILAASDRLTDAWRAGVRARLCDAFGATAAEPWADDIAAAVSVWLAERAGTHPVRDDELDAVIAAALWAYNRDDLAARLLGGVTGAHDWDQPLSRSASPTLRLAALRGWLRPIRGESRAGDVWLLDVRRLFREAAAELDLGRFQLLAAVLDALAAGVAPRRGLDVLVVRGVYVGAARRDTGEVLSFCSARLAEAARRYGWPRLPEILRAELRGRR